MLVFVAIQHGMLAMRLPGTADRLIAVTVGLTTLISGNLAIGFAIGVAILLARGWRAHRDNPAGLSGASA
jgi:hypothetical protein